MRTPFLHPAPAHINSVSKISNLLLKSTHFPFTRIGRTRKMASKSPSSQLTHIINLPGKLGLGVPVVAAAGVSDADFRNSIECTLSNGELIIQTEFMVDMTCEGCVNSVKTKLRTVDGVQNVNVDLTNQVVRVLGTCSVKSLTEALEQTDRKARLIGQGVPEDFIVSAAVAEFKGPSIFGVVRLAQVSSDVARIEANLSGLPSGKLVWSINEFGDLTKGAASTGKVFNPTKNEKEPLGDLGTLEVDEKCDAFFCGIKEKLRVADVIGRSIVVYGSEDKSDEGIAAAVVARSAGVGENYKKLCTCDGTTIWEATDADFITSKV